MNFHFQIRNMRKSLGWAGRCRVQKFSGLFLFDVEFPKSTAVDSMIAYITAYLHHVVLPDASDT